MEKKSGAFSTDNSLNVRMKYVDTIIHGFILNLNAKWTWIKINRDNQVTADITLDDQPIL